MTTRYVGAGGNDSNTGLSWAQRKLTLNGVEDTPVAAGDTVYVGAGTYNEILTVDVSGTSGNVISYIGDYDGSHTDGVGGVVRITGGASGDNITPSLDNAVTANGKDFRLFRGFTIDLHDQPSFYLLNCEDITIDKCYFTANTNYCVGISGADQKRIVVSNCWMDAGSSYAIDATHSATVDNTGHEINNCVFFGRDVLFRAQRVGGITIKNSTFMFGAYQVRVAVALTSGQTITVNNCVMYGGTNAFYALNVGEITENYNTLFQGSRTNTAVGANSITYPPLFDSRWFFEMVNGGSMLSPFDLASYSQLINVAGTSPTTADMRGTTVQGTQREWGALEYDSTLDIEAGTGGGAVSIQPLSGRLGL